MYSYVYIRSKFDFDYDKQQKNKVDMPFNSMPFCAEFIYMYRRCNIYILNIFWQIFEEAL